MSFQHSLAGLSNLHVFSGVDAIVFVEGGESRSIADVRSGKFDSTSSDVGFWQKCFSELGPAITLQFRAVGAKPTLLDLARAVANGATGVYVAMDRDFDHLLGHAIRTPKVLYTFGYSWENDVWREMVIQEVFYTLCNACRTTTVQISQIIASSFSGFSRDLRWATYADFICVKHGVPLLPRHGSQRLMRESRGAPPILDRATIRQCVHDAKLKRTTPINAGAKHNLEPLTDCNGHLISALGYALLLHLLKTFCKSANPPRQIADSIMIDKFFERIRRGQFHELRTHYERQLTA